MTATYEKIATTTLGSASATVTFSSISGSYTDLVLVINGGITDAGFVFGIRLNSDTGSNYSSTAMYGNSSSAFSDRKSNFTLGQITTDMQGGHIFNTHIINFQNYSNTTTNKTWVGRSSANYSATGSGATTVPHVGSVVGLWRNTSAITSISISESGLGGSGSFAYGNTLSGSTFTLYGIKAE